MRYQVTFKKTKAMRFTGHLDLFRTMERTMRRANLPLAYSEGFNPRPKMTLASALPLGSTSEYEVGEFWLKEELQVNEVEAALLEAAPPGMQFINFETIEPKTPKLQNRLVEATYHVILLDFVEDLTQRVADALAEDELIIETVKKGKKKQYNYRERIKEITVLPINDAGQQELHLLLLAHQTANGRADQVLKLLDIDPLACRIHRTGMRFE